MSKLEEHEFFWEEWFSVSFDFQSLITKTTKPEPTVAYSLWTDNQQSVEQSFATTVYEQSVFGEYTRARCTYVGSSVKSP